MFACAALAQYAPAGILQQPSGQLLLPTTYHTLIPKLGRTCRIVGTMALVALVTVLLLLAACHQFIRSATVLTGRVPCCCITCGFSPCWVPGMLPQQHSCPSAAVNCCSTSFCCSLLMPPPCKAAAALYHAAVKL